MDRSKSWFDWVPVRVDNNKLASKDFIYLAPGGEGAKRFLINPDKIDAIYEEDDGICCFTYIIVNGAKLSPSALTFDDLLDLIELKS